MSFTPKTLKLWTMPDSYFGAEWPDHYVFVGQSRDSSCLERSNFICGLEAVGGESETVTVIHEGHWAVGWVEWVGIHKSGEKALRIADEIGHALEGYPVVDESHFSEMEYEEAESYWKSCSVSERLDLMDGSGVSIFAARHDWIPSGDNGFIFERLIS